MASKIDIVNQALVLLGESVISDLSLPVGETVETVYNTTRDSLLTSHRWRFAVKKVALSEAAGSPVNEWANHFTLPSDFLLLISTYPISTYEIYGSKLLTNNDEVEIDYIYDPGEKLYPAYFVKAFATQLASDIALPITNDKTLHELFAQKALNELAAARFKDSQGRPPKAIISRPFIDCRS